MDAKTPHITKFNRVADQLHAASAVINGERWVNATRAMRIAGCSPPCYLNWKKRGWLSTMRVSCDRTRRSPLGFITVLHLGELLGCLKRHRRRPNWTAREDDYIGQEYGRLSVKHIAKKLGRTERAVVDRAKRMGLILFQAQGLMTTGDVGRLLGVCSSRVTHWCTCCCPPLAHTRVPGKRPYIQIDVSDLDRFLASRPDLASRIDERALSILGRMAAPLHERKKAVAA